MKSDLSRRLAAETLGTFFLVMAVVGSGIMAEKLAGGNEVIALLCNTLPTGAVYCATKFAVWAISEGLRQENPDIRVTTISPGVVATELGDDISDQSAKHLLGNLRKTALTPDAIARIVAKSHVDAPAGQ